MSNTPNRRHSYLPPVSLRTAILLMFVAGGWLWWNTMSYDIDSVQYAMLRSNALFDPQARYFCFGHPFTFAISDKPYIWQVAASDMAVSKALLNAFFGACVLWVLASWFSTKRSRSGLAGDQPELKTIKNQYTFFPPIRLSSAILLMFAAGGWIWLNTMPHKDWYYPPYDGSGTYSGPISGFGFGIPFTVTTSPTIELKDARRLTEIDYFSAAVNIFLGVAILWSLAWVFTIVWPNKVARARRSANTSPNP